MKGLEITDQYTALKSQVLAANTLGEVAQILLARKYEYNLRCIYTKENLK